MAAHCLASHLTLKNFQTKNSNETGNNSQDLDHKLWVSAASNWFLPNLCQVNKKQRQNYVFLEAHSRRD